jgi:hypothetical protein
MLKVFEKRVLKKIFGLEGDKATVGWRRLYNEQIHDVYSLPNIFHMIQ